MLEIQIKDYDELTEDERMDLAYYSWDRDEGTCFLLVIHNGETVISESDRMAPEDVSFGRDLGWIPQALRRCYELGKEDADGSQKEDA